MPSKKKVLVAGASGLVGQAAIRHFAHSFEWDVVGVSRRPPLTDDGRTNYVPVDLLDKDRCAEVFGQMSDVTHLVYTAVNEDPNALHEGWRDRERMQLNLQMLENLFEPLSATAQDFQHFSLLQGTKAYGVHAGLEAPMPFRERAPRVEHDNFYFLQEDYMRARQQGQSWHWTVFRPMLILGDAVGSNLNVLIVIGVYAALRKEAGLPLPSPAGRRRISQLIDSDVLASAIVWAATAASARNEIFNNANGDVYSWHDLWPAIAAVMGVEVGPPEPISLAAELPKHAEAWRAIVRKYDLAASEDLESFLGASPQLADGVLIGSQPDEEGPPGIESTIKLRQAGFHECIDSEDSVVKWLRRYQELRLLPPA